MDADRVPLRERPHLGHGERDARQRSQGRRPEVRPPPASMRRVGDLLAKGRATSPERRIGEVRRIRTMRTNRRNFLKAGAAFAAASVVPAEAKSPVRPAASRLKLSLAAYSLRKYLD